MFEEFSILKSLAAIAIKLLKLWSCKAIVVHASKPRNPACMVNFCDWFFAANYDGEVDADLNFFHLHAEPQTKGLASRAAARGANL
jgi:hypothetical protein